MSQTISYLTTTTTVYLILYKLDVKFLLKSLCSVRQHEKQTYSAVSLLGSRSLPGEQDEFGAVLLQTLHVGLKRFCGSVATARINRDANGAGCLFVDASRLQGGAQHIRFSLT